MVENVVSRSKDVLEQVLKAELSASNAYAATIDKVGDGSSAPKLIELKQSHDAAIAATRSVLAKLHDRAKIEDAGVVGKVVNIVHTAASLFGESASVKSLRAGELTYAQYLEELPQAPDLVEDAAALIHDNLLPSVRRHVDGLDALSQAG